MTFQVIQIVYWLALAAWFGGVLFVMLAAPVVFRTVRDANPVLPDVLSVNLENQHGTLLAGTIVGNLLAQLTTVQVVCAVALAGAMAAQLAVVDLQGNNGIAAILRALLLIGAIGLALYDRYVLWPKIMRHRDQYVAHADEPEVANPAKDEFDRLHHRSVSLLMGTLCMLLGLVLFSPNISPKSASVISPAADASSATP